MCQATSVQLSDTFADVNEDFEPLPGWSGRREILVDGNARGILRAHAGATLISNNRLNQPPGTTHARTDGQAIEEVVHQRQEYLNVNGLFDYFDGYETLGLSDTAAQVDRAVRPPADWSQHTVCFILNDEVRRRRSWFETDP